MAKTIMKLSVEQPRYKIMNELDFNDFYEIYYTYTYNRNEDINRVYVGERSGSCIFCGEKIENGAKFSKDAHVIPAFLGSPKLFSRNECDKCNQYFGDELENSLAKMLNPILLISGVLPRCGPVKKIKGQGIEASFHRGSGVEVKSHLEMKMDLNEGRVNIPIPSEEFNPQKALRSLLHTFWMILDDTTRNSYMWIKDSLFDHSLKIPSILYIGVNTPGVFNQVSLNVYNLKSQNEALCEYILKLQYNSSCLYYGIYHGDFKNILIQPFEVDDTLPILPILKILDYKDSTHQGSSIQNIQYSFIEFENQMTGEKGKSKKEYERCVMLSLRRDDEEKRFEGLTSLTYYANGSIVVGGINFTARLCFKIDSISMSLLPEGCTVVDIKNTMDFLKLIDDHLIISHPSKGEIVTIKGQITLDIDETFEKIINALYFLSIQFGKDIHYSTPNSEDINSLMYLSYLTNLKGIRDFRISFSSIEEFREYCEYIFNNKSSIIKFPKRMITILGKSYDFAEIIYVKYSDICQISKDEDNFAIVFQDVEVLHPGSPCNSR